MSNKNIETHVVKPAVTMVVGGNEHRLIEVGDEVAMDKMIQDIDAFMKSNDGEGLSEDAKDALYGSAISMWGEYARLVKSVKFKFYLNRKQYKFLTDLLVKKLDYDVDTVFLAIELTNMLGTWSENGSTHTNDTDVNGYEADATEITYIYHLIAKYTIKGLSNDSYRFAEVLRKIGDISKIINYYDSNAQNSNAEIQKWAASFTALEEESVELEVASE